MPNPHCKDIPQDMFEKHDYHHQWETIEKPFAELENLEPAKAPPISPRQHQGRKTDINQ